MQLEALDTMARGRTLFTFEEWRNFLLRSIGLEPVSKESIRGFGSTYMVGNFDVGVTRQQRIGHLLVLMPPEMRDDTAFMDRIHAHLPGWTSPR
jgi:predicted ATP-dependent Lon-type protease